MKKSFDDILDICLDRITVKGDSVEQCLESYPEQAAELEPLLRAALSTRKAASVIKPSLESRASTRNRLLSALEARENKKIEHQVPFWGWQRRWAVAFAAVLVLILVGVGTVSASTSSLPGDTLYPVKTATEKVQGFFTLGSEAKANFHMKLAQRRLDEVKSLAESNRNIPQTLLGVMNVETNEAIEILSRDEGVGNKSIDRLMGLTSNQKTVLTEVIDKVAPKAKLRLQDEMKRCEDAHARALTLKDRIHQMKMHELSPSPSP